jgi:hypothetical protein
MTLYEFLGETTPAAVDTLLDARLFNVVLEGGALYGVEVTGVPPMSPLTRRGPVTRDGALLQVDGLTFDTTAYTMLPDA